MRSLIGTLLLCGTLLAAAGGARADTPDGELQFDKQHSDFGFELSTRWGQKLVGRFPHFDGKVVALADGRQQVQLRMYTRDVEIVGHPRYSEWARGERFFGAQTWPAVVFVSQPYSEEMLHKILSPSDDSRPPSVLITRRAGLEKGRACPLG